ncbi:phenylalanine--tRNA ligase subunit beta, partial [Candidatus Woesearchaeota archaeon]|nr:phenylalanine--tRNA ligase subunit beta [Candidatus Woesearchaeota archaeon]
MPTITFDLNDLGRLVGKKLSVSELEELVPYAKGEVDGYDKRTNEVSVSLDDTNLPYLWGVEGMARLFRGVLGMQKGIPKLEVKK